PAVEAGEKPRGQAALRRRATVHDDRVDGRGDVSGLLLDALRRERLPGRAVAPQHQVATETPPELADPLARGELLERGPAAQRTPQRRQVDRELQRGAPQR